MKLKTIAAVLALATGFAAGTSATASAPDERELWEMLKKSAEMRTDGMATKAVQKRSDAEETARILDPNVANP